MKGLGAARAGPDVSDSIEGTVAGDVFHFTGPSGTWEGTLTVSGNKMECPATTGAIGGKLTLRRVDPSSPPGS